jgi:Tfp pilus assembly protein PilO
MKRSMLMLTGLGAVLVVALWWLLMWSPGQDRLATVEADIESTQTEQATARTRISELEGVREQAPQLQAELAASESLLPRDTALPSALRQLQVAADESGATLVSVAPARPEPVEGVEVGLYSMTMSAEVRGTYFQIVDTLRRLEDPAISPRGLVWDSTTISVNEEAGAPNIIVVLTGQMFSVLPSPPAPEAGETPPVADGTAEEGADGGDAESGDAAEGEADSDVEANEEVSQ